MAENRVNIDIVTRRFGGQVITQTNRELQSFNKAAVKTGKQAVVMQDGILRSATATGTLREKTEHATSASQGFESSLVSLAWSFRYLNSVMQRVWRTFVDFTRDIIETGVELEESYFGIEAAAAMYGQEAEKALKLTERLATEGFLPLKESQEVVRDLMVTGMGVPEMTDFIERYTDITAVLTSDADALAGSLRTLSQSIIRGTTVLATDVAARLVWNMANKRSQEQLGANLEQLTANQRAIIVHQTLLEDLAEFEGLHELQLKLTSAQLQSTAAQWRIYSKELFNMVAPALYYVLQLIQRGIQFLRAITAVLGDWAPAVYVATGVLVGLTSALTGFIAVGLVALRIKVMISGQLGVITTAYAHATKGAVGFIGALNVLKYTMRKLFIVGLKVLGPILLIGAALSYLMHRVFDVSGAFDMQRDKLKDVAKGLEDVDVATKGLGDTMKEMEDDMAGGSDRSLKFERQIADLKEEIAREESLGLWKDERKLEDLRKQLGRTEEDYGRYLDEGEGAGAGMGNIFDEMLKSIEDLSMGTGDWMDEWMSDLEEMPSLVDRIRYAFQKLWDWIKDIDWGAIWEWIKEIDWVGEYLKIGRKMSEGILNGMKAVGEFFMNLGGKTWKWIRGIDWGEIGKFIGEAIRGGIIAILEFFKELNEKVTKWLKRTDWEKIGEKIGKWIGDRIVDLGKFSFKYNFVTLPYWIIRWLIKRDWEEVGEKVAGFFTSGIGRVLLAWATVGISEAVFRGIREEERDFDEIGRALGEWIVGGITSFLTSYKAGASFRRGIISGIRGSMPEIPSWVPLFGGDEYDKGGVVPGRVGQPRLVMAHGGETILPTHRSDYQGGGDVIFQNVNVRDDKDIDEIARRVGEVMGTKQRRTRMGGY